MTIKTNKHSNMYKIKRTDAEIDRVLNKTAEGIDAGSAYPGDSYEEGIQCFALWLFGDTEDGPFDE